MVDPGVGVAGGTTLQTVTVGNKGAATTGGVQMTFVTPTYVNVDRQRPLPGNCAFLFEDQDSTVPEIVRCALPDLAKGERRTVTIPLAVTRNAPPSILAGMAIALPQSPADHELSTQDNVATTIVYIERSGEEPPGTVDLFLAGDAPAVGGPLPSTQTFVVGNSAAQPTRGDVALTFSTPFFVNVDRARALPNGCAFRYQNSDPSIPEIVRCVLPPGLASGQPVTLRIPLVAVPGGPVGRVNGNGAVATAAGSPDSDIDRLDNGFGPTINALGPSMTRPSSATPSSNVAEIQAAPAPLIPASTEAPTRTYASSGTTPTATSNVSSAAGGASIDLRLSSTSVAAAAGDSGIQRFTLTNRGADATGAHRLVYSVPPFTIVDRSKVLPGQCDFLYENLDPTVPEIVQCRIAALKHGASATLDLPLSVAPGSPSGQFLGLGMVIPAADSSDTEQFLNDNRSAPAVAILFDPDATRPPPDTEGVDLYIWGDFPQVAPGGTTISYVHIGNKGPQPTRGETRVTFATPLFVNIDRGHPLPSGCTIIYANLDPAVPEILECLVPAGIPAGNEAPPLAIPISAAPGGAPGGRFGNMIVRPGSRRDRERDLRDNVHLHGVVITRHP
ncbi:hypothetical protein [Pendulispora albinea]|uniref:Uncharacterized protein n=1 Tax=Pendulispora albinea TaxID=2741071 RepID=A0ABZ2LYT8_9BACT